MTLLLPKIQVIEDPKHVRFAHQLECVICGGPAEHFHHLRRAKSRRGQYKAGDNHGLPLCCWHHNIGADSLHGQEQFGVTEPEYFERNGIADPYGLADGIYDHTGDHETCIELIRGSRNSVEPAQRRKESP